METTLSSLLLPECLLNYFSIVHIDNQDTQVHLFLEEISISPERKGFSYLSKGFTESSTVQDFPIRGKAVYLHIKRRKWLEEQTGRVITNSIDITHFGTHLSKEFAAFLKDCYRG